MLKKSFLLLLFVATSRTIYAQSADVVYNQYLDFNLARFDGDEDKTVELGERILPNADKLPEKARVNFFFGIGKMYEDDNQYDKAITYYEKVAAAVPDYYVAHRALGYLYLNKAKQIEKQLSSSLGDKAMEAQLKSAYTANVKMALPHLEKAQACDPSSDTLEIIKNLYQNINDSEDLISLNNRLKTLGKNCIDILTDQ
jgi:tetratricopeptide (TPR) repeat protein